MQKVNYPAYTDNQPANTDLASGEAQYGGQFIPGIERPTSRETKANHHYWFPPTTNVALYFNIEHPVTSK